MINEGIVASWFCTRCQLELPLGNHGRHVVALGPPVVSPRFDTATVEVIQCSGPVWARSENGRLFCPIHCIDITTHADREKRFLVCSYEQVMADVLATIKTIHADRDYRPRTWITPEGEFHA